LRSAGPRVSIATGLYNHRPFLAERARSILTQTLADFEWIVVDDCSTDGSYEEISRLTAGDRRVRVLRNDGNQGFMRANQRAIDQGRGTFLYRADSDDSCDRRFLETMVGILDAHPRAGFAYCRGLRMDAENGIWGGIPVRRARYIKAPDAFPELALNYQIRAPSILFRRDKVMQVGGFDQRPSTLLGEWHADWHLSLRMALTYDLTFHPEPLAYHRTHSTNLSGASRLTINNFALLEDVFDRLPDAHRHYDALRPRAYRAVADRLYSSISGPRAAHGSEFAEAVSVIAKYIPGYTPPPPAPIKRALQGFTAAATKLLTYRKIRTP